MGLSGTVRTVLALSALAVGLIGAVVAGAPILSVVILLVAGLLVHALAPSGMAPRTEPIVNEESAQPPSLPDVSDVLGAVDEPRLVVRDRRVLLANAAAKAVLGEHIEGVDVRLAIRHPAAAERLADRPGEAGEPMTRTELVGLGEPGRRWEMTTSRLSDGSRLVRLTDRSRIHAAEKMRADFVANASHELRTPLATLLGFLETLQDEKAAQDSKTRRRFLKIMFDEATRMRDLVDDLMSLSRIEADRFSVPRDPVDLVPLIEEVEAGLANLIEERDATLVLVNEAGAAEVAGDRPQLAQLLNNLLVNALKYGRRGTPVKVRLDDAGPELLRLSVIDKGEGIAPEHLPRLTERFYRVDAGRSRSVGGTGLGLAIVKHITQRHRGRLEIKSKIGEGTDVRVYLPRAQPAAMDALSSKSHPSVTEGSSSRPSPRADPA
jgi:two-component system, OmpR family, phosphate regulon sensor histidine kinase PhoR